MTNDNDSILIGLGCSTAASTSEIVGLVEACLREANCQAGQIVAFATHSRKRGSESLVDTAIRFGVPLFFLDDDALAPGIDSTCEAVVAAAGPLQLGKRKSRYATCAIARCDTEFSVASLAQPVRPSAAIAASRSATSVAGP